MECSETGFLAALARITLISSVELAAPLRFFGSAGRLWRAPAAALLASGLKPASAGLLNRERRSLDPDRETALIYKEGLTALTWADPDYPRSLRELPGAPPIIFVRGSVAVLQTDRLIAVVGTRRLTTYGEAAAKLICRPLAAAGVGIVSGLALGIDAVAHAAALDGSGPTVAVLGSGVDRASVGPRSNFGLAERIVSAGGALVSEYPPGVEGQKHHFPLRNRIIAGLSRGTVVIEAALRSGALITAAAALEYGRDVFSVPGPITQPASAGSNDLIRQGATPVVSAAEILEYYGWKPAGTGRIALAELDPEQLLVCRTLAGGPLEAETLSGASGLDISRLTAALARLEIAGLVEKIGNQWSPRFDSPRQRRLI